MSQAQLENPKLETDLRDLAQDIVRRAMQGGATAAECVVREGDEFSTLVRLGQVETLKESGSRSIGVRVFNGQRAASTYSSDFSTAALDRMVKSALELSKITSEDPFGGIPEASQLGSLTGDLDLYYEDVYSLSGPDRIDYARRAEKAALDFDPRIKNSEGGSFDAATGHKVCLRRRIPAVVLFHRRRPHRANRRGRDAARLLVRGSTYPGETRIARAGRQGCGRAHPAPPGRTQGKDRSSTGDLRSHGGHVDPGTYFRRRKRRLRLPWRLVPGGQAGTENCRRQRYHHRRRHHRRRLRHEPLRWRRRPDAPHRSHQERCVELILDEHLHREEAGTRDHSQRFPRPCRHSRHRPGQLLPTAWPQDAEAIDF